MRYLRPDRRVRAASIMLMLLVAGCAGDSDYTAPTAAPTTPELVGEPHWLTATVLGRQLSSLRVRFAGGDEAAIDLKAVAVFDCRTDCWRDIKDSLTDLPAGTEVCVLSQSAGAEEKIFKLWVARASCAPGPGR